MQNLPDIYFLHIPKTAGSSLTNLIHKSYPVHERLDAFEWYELVKIESQRLQEYRCFTGHFGTGLFSLLDRQIPTVTLLRDPFERVVSHLNFAWARSRQNHRGLWARMLGQLPVMTYFKYVLARPQRWRAFDNVQTYHLGVDLDLRPWRKKPDHRELAMLLKQLANNQSQEEILQKAKRTLNSMAVVGTVERLGESVKLICAHLGIPVPDTLPTKNVSPVRQLHVRYQDTWTFPTWMRDRIESLIELDRDVYTYGCRLLETRLTHGKHLP